MKIIKVSLIVALMYLFISIGWQSVFGYFSVSPNYCTISIQEHFGYAGDRTRVQQALKTLRMSDAEAYQDTCAYVDTISMKRCFNTDGHVDSGAFNKIYTGCFIRGTHTVYLLPDQSVDVYVDTLSALAPRARVFWK